jgi:copper homeostasis protein
MILEVIATHLSDVIDAEKYGADRLELSPGMLEDGITPSFGLIEAAVQNAKIPINVMIRPHSKSFVYDENDIETMIKDIQIAKKLGANGIVFGALTKDGQIDKEVVKRLLAEA